jgi:hypothetical protein
MAPPIPPVLFTVLLVVGMLVMLEAGGRLAIRRGITDSEEQRLGTIEASMFALFGLLVAFTFSGAALRFNEKRMLIAEEANAIGTAYLRLQLLQPKAQPELQDLFRRYVDSRFESYRRLPDMAAAQQEMAKSQNIQDAIWAKSVDATRDAGAHPDAGKLLLPALNTMIDVTTTRTMALQVHPPAIIYALLFGLALICSFLAGYRVASGGNRSWLHVVLFALATAIVVYVILDVEYPRAGLFRLEAADQLLVDLRQKMR